MKRKSNNRSAIRGIVWILSMAACEPATPGTTGPDAPGPDAGLGLADAAETDGGSIPNDAGVPDATEPDATIPDSGCPVHTHPAGQGCETTLTWRELPVGPPSRDHHVTFLKAHGDSATLYVSGGLDEHARLLRSDLWYAHLDADGTLTRWSRGPNPPKVQLGSGVAVAGARAYLVGGKTFMGNRVIDSAAVHSLGLAEDGAPLEWRTEPPLPAPRFHGSVEVVGGFLYAIGGLETQPGFSAPEVWRAAILADGALSEWTAVSPLPEGRSHHSSFVHDRTLYVLGGLNGSGVGFSSQTFFDYLKATVDADGNLSDWTRVNLPFGTSTQSAIVLSDRVVLLGGFDEDFTILDAVRSAPLEGGVIGPWTTLSPLLYPRAHVHHTPFWRGRVYSVGGNIGNHVAVDRVLGGTFE